MMNGAVDNDSDDGNDDDDMAVEEVSLAPIPCDFFSIHLKFSRVRK